MRSKTPDKVIEKLKKIARSNIRHENYERALAAISNAGNILYYWNQFFTDKDLEDGLMSLSSLMLRPQNSKFVQNNNTILFYDGFGGDTRGLAAIYLKGLVRLNYQVVYLVPERARHNQPHLHQLLVGGNIVWEYYPERKFTEHALKIQDCFETYKPSKAILYTSPGDTSAIIVFNAYKDLVERYQINLTDHAFWLGVNAFDYCIEFRQFGCILSQKYRGIPKERIILLPYYPYIDKTIPFSGFTKEIEGKKIVFSGGSLYKTLGDKENRYYKIVGKLLNENSDVVFIYAGKGDDSELKKIISKYPGRAYHIAERKDLYQVLKRSTIYLSTFPMFGGLMSQYAVSSGVIPLTLVDRSYDSSRNVLLGQEEMGIIFTDYNTLVDEANRLIRDNTYRHAKYEQIKGCVISENKFEEELHTCLEDHYTCFEVSPERELELQDFIERYRKRFNYKMITKNMSRSVIFYFPRIFLYRLIEKLAWKK